MYQNGQLLTWEAIQYMNMLLPFYVNNLFSIVCCSILPLGGSYTSVIKFI